MLIWLESPTTQYFFERILAILVDSGAKGLLLLLMALLICIKLRRASAAARHLVWALALGGLLLLPVLSLVMPKWQLPILPRLSTSAEQPVAPALEHLPLPSPAQPAAPIPYHFAKPSEITPLAAIPSASAPRPQHIPQFKPRLPLAVWVTAAWMVAAFLALIPLLVGLLFIRRLVRKAEPLSQAPWPGQIRSLANALALRRPVQLLQTSESTMPMATGLFKPTILLPQGIENWPEEKLRAVLLHELAHVKRRDCLIQALARLAAALHWFNPLAWLALRRLRIERERACDDLVLTAGQRPSAYADHLLDVARTMNDDALASAAAITMARKSQLEGRLLAILDSTRNRRPMSRSAFIWAVLVLTGVLMPLGITRFTVRANEDSSSLLAERQKSTTSSKLSIGVKVLFGAVTLPTFKNENVDESLKKDGREGIWWRFEITLAGNLRNDFGGIWEIKYAKNGKVGFYEDDNREKLRIKRTLTAALPEKPDRVEVRYGLAQGDWVTGFDMGPEGASGAGIGHDGEIMVSAVSADKDGCSFDMGHTVTNHQLRLLVKTISGGQVLPTEIRTIYHDNLHHTHVKFTGIHSNQIDRVLVQFRKYEWTSFHNIARPSNSIGRAEDAPSTKVTPPAISSRQPNANIDGTTMSYLAWIAPPTPSATSADKDGKILMESKPALIWTTQGRIVPPADLAPHDYDTLRSGFRIPKSESIENTKAIDERQKHPILAVLLNPPVKNDRSRRYSCRFLSDDGKVIAQSFLSSKAYFCDEGVIPRYSVSFDVNVDVPLPEHANLEYVITNQDTGDKIGEGVLHDIRLLPYPPTHPVTESVNSTSSTARLQFRWVATDAERGQAEEVPMPQIKTKLWLLREILITEKDIAPAEVRPSSSRKDYDVILMLKGDAKERFARLTEQNIQRRLAMVLDGKIISAPAIREKIAGGRIVISGGFPKEMAEEMAKTINQAQRSSALDKAIEAAHARMALIRTKKMKFEYTRTTKVSGKNTPYEETCTLLAYGGNYREEVHRKDGETEFHYYTGVPRPGEPRYTGELHASEGIRATMPVKKGLSKQFSLHPYSHIHGIDTTLTSQWSIGSEGYWPELRKRGSFTADAKQQGHPCIEFKLGDSEDYYSPELGWAYLGSKDCQFTDFVKKDGLFWPRKITDHENETITISKIESNADFDLALLDLPKPKHDMEVSIEPSLWHPHLDGITGEDGGWTHKSVDLAQPLSPENARLLTVAQAWWRMTDFSQALNSGYPMPYYYDQERQVIVWAKYDKDLGKWLKVFEGDNLPEKYGPAPWRDMANLTDGWFKK